MAPLPLHPPGRACGGILPVMNYRSVGASGLRVSSISLGGWLTFGGSIGKKDTQKVVHAALDGGVNFIDLADVYARGAAEEVAGGVLSDLPRHELVVSSKCFWPMSDDPNDRGLSRKHIIESCDRSLQRLRMDYLDLYFCHREDPDTPLVETVRAMHHLVEQGKVLYWGTSCWSAERLRETHRLCDQHGWHAPIVEQPQYSLLHRDPENTVEPACHELGMGLVVWSPLAGGALTGKYNDGVPEGSRGATTSWLDSHLNEDGLERLRAFAHLADEAGCKPAQLALAWLLSCRTVSSVITGATRGKQVKENLGALEVDVDDALAARLDELFPRTGA